MNRSLAHKMISKQESMVHLAGLDLHLCSETIETVSISGGYRLAEEGHVSKAKSLLKRYATRKENIQLSFDDYYDSLKNTVKMQNWLFLTMWVVKACQCILLQRTMPDLFYFYINLGLESFLMTGGEIL